MTVEKQDLEARLIEFGIQIIRLTETLPRTPAGRHLSEQILRSGTAPALNYAEAKAGASHRDFTNTIKTVLKEVRETWVNLRMIDGSGIHPEKHTVTAALRESSELVANFTESVRTAEKKSPPRN